MYAATEKAILKKILVWRRESRGFLSLPNSAENEYLPIDSGAVVLGTVDSPTVESCIPEETMCSERHGEENSLNNLQQKTVATLREILFDMTGEPVKKKLKKAILIDSILSLK